MLPLFMTWGCDVNKGSISAKKKCSPNEGNSTIDGRISTSCCVTVVSLILLTCHFWPLMLGFAWPWCGWKKSPKYSPKWWFVMIFNGTISVINHPKKTNPRMWKPHMLQRGFSFSSHHIPGLHHGERTKVLRDGMPFPVHLTEPEKVGGCFGFVDFNKCCTLFFSNQVLLCFGLFVFWLVLVWLCFWFVYFYGFALFASFVSLLVWFGYVFGLFALLVLVWFALFVCFLCWFGSVWLCLGWLFFSTGDLLWHTPLKYGNPACWQTVWAGFNLGISGAPFPRRWPQNPLKVIDVIGFLRAGCPRGGINRKTLRMPYQSDGLFFF